MTFTLELFKRMNLTKLLGILSLLAPSTQASENAAEEIVMSLSAPDFPAILPHDLTKGVSLVTCLSTCRAKLLSSNGTCYAVVYNRTENACNYGSYEEYRGALFDSTQPFGTLYTVGYEPTCINN